MGPRAGGCHVVPTPGARGRSERRPGCEMRFFGPCRTTPENAGERRKTPEAARRKNAGKCTKAFSQLHFDPQ
eukprot:14396617-Alexandrium_andersonii.AAC.1